MANLRDVYQSQIRHNPIDKRLVTRSIERHQKRFQRSHLVYETKQLQAKRKFSRQTEPNLRSACMLQMPAPQIHSTPQRLQLSITGCCQARKQWDACMLHDLPKRTIACCNTCPNKLMQARCKHKRGSATAATAHGTIATAIPAQIRILWDACLLHDLPN